MSSSIGTHSVQNPSIFSCTESHLSINTEWTSETLVKLDDCEGSRVDNNLHIGQQKSSRQGGRPPNKWTRTRLRKLTRLYLLTDLDLDGIINCLRTEEFQPCKRNVQEKLALLLQPQPNTIRPKGNAKTLRRLLLECKQLQMTRRARKQQHRHRLQQRQYPHEDGFHSESVGFSDGNISNALPISLESCSHGIHFLDSVPSERADSFSLSEAQNENCQASNSIFDFELPIGESITAASDLTNPSLNQDLLDYRIQSELPEDISAGGDFSYAIYLSSDVTSIYDCPALQGPLPDFGFGSDFGPRNFHAVSKSSFIQSMPGSTTDIDGGLACPGVLQVNQTSSSVVASPGYLSAPRKLPIVNATHVREEFDTASGLLSETFSCYDFDPVYVSIFDTKPSAAAMLDHLSQAECASLPDSQISLSVMEGLSTSKISLSSSQISTLLSKISLNPSPTSPVVQPAATAANSTTVVSTEVETPVILPGVFPEYCWQHINQNRLRRCCRWDGLPKCNSKRDLKNSPTHRSLRADVLSRIVQRTIRAADIHEIDTFGNSAMHISAIMLAPPSYLVSLIKLGANANKLNNGGQTFLHLVKLEVLDYCDDFCHLLEILSAEGFDFSQHDHLGQSPLHLLMRPWIRSDILQKVIATLDSLPIHRQMSTARDCLGYTVVGQMNLQETQASTIDLDQAMLSLACETEKPIFDQYRLQMSKSKSQFKSSSNKDEHPARNYENHPSIQTVDDLLRYEQHVDYWRTIVAAKDTSWFEDSNGRNGLHCLAEASLVSSDMPLPSLLLDQLESIRTTEPTDSHNEREYLIKSLLSAGVDPNNYDNNGNTPFMAFIIHARAGEDDDSTSRILNYLLEAGSDIHRRNRQGETALHLAIKFGRRAATKFLLVSGVNIHARTKAGLGVLELGQKYSMENKRDETLYAQILLCMSLAASFGAVSRPTILDEWGSPEWKLTVDNRRESNGFKLKLAKKFISNKVRGSSRGT